jgi:phage I-like protein
VGESNKVKRFNDCWIGHQRVEMREVGEHGTYVLASDYDALQSQLAHLTQQRDAIQLSEHRLTAALKAIRATLPHIDGNRMSIHNMLFVIDAALALAQEAQT